jgi:uridine kinase
MPEWSSSGRLVVLDDLAARIAGVLLKHTLRVAIDGRTAAGKTVLSDELATLIRKRARPVIRTSIDGFHRPKAVRYARGRHSAEGYYHDARDLGAIVTLLLAPLGPGGNRSYRTASFDLQRDQPITQGASQAPDNAVLIVDGTFLQRPELRDEWDLTIFVKVSAEVAERRGVSRDAAELGGVEAARKLHVERYAAAFDLYNDLCAPEDIADVVLDNDDLPSALVREGCLIAAPVT